MVFRWNADWMTIIFCRKLGLHMHYWFYILQFLKQITWLVEKSVRGLRILNEVYSLMLNLLLLWKPNFKDGVHKSLSKLNIILTCSSSPRSAKGFLFWRLRSKFCVNKFICSCDVTGSFLIHLRPSASKVAGYRMCGWDSIPSRGV
jgi:hypothetical protein